MTGKACWRCFEVFKAFGLIQAGIVVKKNNFKVLPRLPNFADFFL